MDGVLPITAAALLSSLLHLDADQLLLLMSFINLAALALGFAYFSRKLVMDFPPWFTILVIPLLALTLYRPLVVALSVPYWRDALRYVYYGFLEADFGQTLPFYSLARFYSPSLDITLISVTAGVIVWLERKQTKSYILLGVWAAGILIASLTHYYAWAALFVLASIHTFITEIQRLRSSSTSISASVKRTLTAGSVFLLASLPILLSLAELGSSQEALIRSGALFSRRIYPGHQVLFLAGLVLTWFKRKAMPASFRSMALGIALTGLITADSNLITGVEVQNDHFVTIIGPITVILILLIIPAGLSLSVQKGYLFLSLLAGLLLLANSFRWSSNHANQYFSRYWMTAQEAALQKELDNETYLGKVILPPDASHAAWLAANSPAFFFLGEGVSTVSSPEIPNGELVGRCWIGDRLLNHALSGAQSQEWISDCLDFSLHYYFWPGWSGVPSVKYQDDSERQRAEAVVWQAGYEYLEGKLDSGCQGLALDFLVFDKDSQTPESGTFDQLNRLGLQKRWENDRYLIVEVMGKDRLCTWLKERLQNERGTLSTTTLPITP